MAHEIASIIKQKILVLDGGMGTAIQDLDLGPEDFGGTEFDGCNEYLNLVNPDVIKNIHTQFLNAGSDIIETNTFGATPLVLDEYGLGSKAYEINLAAAKIAVECARSFSEPKFVAGSMGPTTKAISVTGGITFDELKEEFKVQAKALLEGGVDYLLIETCQDTLNIKAAMMGVLELFEAEGRSIPVAVSGTIEPMGTMLGGQTVEALGNALGHFDLLYIGLNCATGPEFMTDYLRSLHGEVPFPIGCVPNAGLPDENGNYLETPELLAQNIERFIQQGWVQLIGGCCGTTPEHIKSLRKLADRYRPASKEFAYKSKLSGLELVEINDDNRPIIVGERTNVIGSRKFKKLIEQEQFDEATEIGKAQIKTGAALLDVCLANPDRDELKDMTQFLELMVKKIKVPLMVDSTDEKVVEESLKYSQGKAIINSINLEEGEERFQQIVPLARKYGAALVVGTIDEDPVQGMGVSRERKLAIGSRCFEILTQKYGVQPADIYFDPLVFPCATGDENYIGSAVETIEGIRLLKTNFPESKTVLGISNVSFGLPAAGREVLNSVFLYHCTKAGLDLALVNSQGIKRYSSLLPEEIELADNLLFNKGDDPVAAFANYYRGKKAKTTPKKELPLMERVPQYIIEGSKEGLIPDLDTLLQSMEPMEIINGPLMGGMAIVGKLFNENKLIVAEVLQSAEVMKTAVAYLEPLMKDGTSKSLSKGKIVLATVKGDVHDIGKNLVDIVLTNNGYEVVNLGIKVPSEQLISAIKEHEPDMVGLSGLLVKSAKQMDLSADDLSKAGIKVPLIVGGAALSKKFVNSRIATSYDGIVVYAKDAMDGLDIANQITQPDKFEQLKQKLLDEQKNQSEESATTKKSTKQWLDRSKLIQRPAQIPVPSDFDRHILKNTPIEVIWKYINPLMLYGRHLGIKGKIVRLLEEGSFKEACELPNGERSVEIFQQVEEVKKIYKHSHLKPKAAYQFFRVMANQNTLSFYSDENYEQKLMDINFGRQEKEDGLCLTDYVLPAPEKGDSIGLFVVTVGEEISKEVARLKEAGNYLHSHILSALALESAEAYAEYIHKKMRSFWGYTEPLDQTMMDLFKARYQGKRYSFGYPACPNLESQEQLFALLNPTPDLGVELTDGFMMEPEASVSALVFHHEQASYFSIGYQGDE